MPLSEATKGLIGGTITSVAPALTDKINYGRQKKANEQNREENAYWNMQARQWAIEDRAYENAYNHPQQQMKRLKEAGLNPHLVYGNGVTASSADTHSTSPNAGKAESVNAQGPGNFMSGFLATIMQVVQTDNLRAQRELIEEQKRKAEADRNLTNWNETRSRGLFDLDKAKLESDIEKNAANITFTLDANERAKVDLELKKVKNAADIKQIASNILHQKIQNAKTQQETENLKIALKKLENEAEWQKVLTDAGINPSGGISNITAGMFAKLWSWLTR